MPKSRTQIYDELIVIKCQQGDAKAFGELVDRWQKQLWRYAFQLTGSESTAWDVVQETWYGIIKGLRKLEDAAVFPQWAFRILNNKCTDWLRKQYLQSRLDDEIVKQTQNYSNVKEYDNGNLESLYAAISKLSPDQRAVLMLRYSEGFETTQIAEILGVPDGTVKSRLHRTLNQLRQMAERHQND